MEVLTSPLASPVADPAPRDGAGNGILDKDGVACFVTDGSVCLLGRPSNKLKTGSWKSAGFLYAVTFTDMVTIIGVSANLFSYLLFTMHLLPARAANIVTNFMGLTYLLPFFWAFVSDAYLGRFLTISLSLIIGLAGLAILTVQSATKNMLPPLCETYPKCPATKPEILTLFQAGLFLLSVGSAGLKPCIASLGQDQFDEGDPVEKAQSKHFFTGFYVFINLGAVVSVTLITWASTIQYKWAFLAVTLFSVLGAILFFLGTPFYRHQKPGGSAFTQLAQVGAAAFSNFQLPLPADSSELHELDDKDLALRGIRKVAHTDRLRFLDKAAIRQEGETSNWKQCTVTQVENLKTIIQLLPIWLTNIVVYTLFAQVLSFTQQQGISMNRHIGNGKFVIPVPSIAIFLMGAAFVSVAVWETVVRPVARRYTGNPLGFTHLQRIGVGLVAAIFSMVAAALVESRRVSLIKTHNITPAETQVGLVPMAIFWLLPQYMILGFVEFVIGVAQLNFFFQEVPDGMKSIGTSFYFTAISMGYFFSSILVNIVNASTKSWHGGWLSILGLMTGGLEWFYWLLGGIVAANAALFILFAYLYVPKKVAAPEPLEETAHAL